MTQQQNIQYLPATVSITTAGEKLLGANSHRVQAIITNTGATAAVINSDQATVVAGAGATIPGSTTFVLKTGAAVWAATASGTTTISVWDEYDQNVQESE